MIGSFLLCISLNATVLTPPTITAEGTAHEGTYVGTRAVSQTEEEFLSNSEYYLEFDFGSDKTITGFVNVTPADATMACGWNRLIFDTDGTPGFDPATDMFITFTKAQTGEQGQGFIQRFPPVTARRVKWEVLEPMNSFVHGTAEMAFLSVANGTIPVSGVTVIGASPALSSQYAAANASNGVAGRGFLPGVEYASNGGGTNTYVDFDLGVVTAVTGFDLFDRLTAADRTTSFDLIFSNNADMSSPVATKSYSKATTWTASDTFAPVTARYVRFDVTGGSGNTGVGDLVFYKASTVPTITVEQSLGSELTDGVTGWGTRPATVDNFRVPPGLANVKRVLSGPTPYGLVLKRYGTVSSWGWETYATGFDPPGTGLTDVIDLAVESDYFLALKNDGTITRFATPSNNPAPETLPPSGVPNAVAITAGQFFGMALKSDGTVTGWGNVYTPGTGFQSLNTLLSGVTNVVSIYARDYTAWVVKGDGTIQGWGTINGGAMYAGHLSVPVGLTGVVAISGTSDYTLALKSNGTVVAWGKNNFGQCDVPPGLSDVVAISAGGYFSYALKSDGTLVGWGTNNDGSLDTPAGIGAVTSLSSNGGQNLALRDSNVVAFGSQATGSSSTAKTITLRNSGFGPLAISSVTLAGANTGDFALNTSGMSSNVASGATTSFTIAFAPTSANLRTAKIRIVSDDPLQGTKDMALSGFGVSTLAQEINVQPAGPQSLGLQQTNVAAAPRSFTIENLGDLPLTITSVSTTGGDAGEFTVNTTGMSSSVAGGAKTTFTIVFTPSITGTRSTTLRIVSNDGDEATLDIALTGTGTNVTPPTVTSPTSSNIAAKSATLGGTITDGGSGALRERGIVYALTSVNADPVIGATGVRKVVVAGNTVSLFNTTVSGLNSGSTYSFKAYATNDGGTSYSDAATFTTMINDASLSALAISTGTFAPVFNRDTQTYGVSLANSIASMTVTPTAASPNARIAVRVNRDAFADVISGSASQTLPLNAGANNIDILLTAEDGSTKLYTIIASRAPSANASLSNLTLSTGALSPSFNTSVLSYTTPVPNATASITVTPTVAQANATVLVNDVRTTSGTASSPIALTAGTATQVTIKVTAQDGVTQQTYTATITRDPPANTAPSFSLPSPATATFGNRWSAKPEGVSALWSAAALSNSGQKIIVCALSIGSLADAVWTSADYGITWQQRSVPRSPHSWGTVCSSADGTKLAIGDGLGKVWTSTDGGATWTERSSLPVSSVTDIACSSDGMKLIASAGGNCYTSFNQGLTWTARSVPSAAQVASSADGTKLAVGAGPFGVYVSSNSGVTWTRTMTSAFYVTDVKMSATGSRLYATAFDSSDPSLHVSTDLGGTWTRLFDDARSLDCSADGSILAVGSAAGVQYSTDAGTTWHITPADPGSFNAIAFSGDGSRLMVLGGRIAPRLTTASSSANLTALADDPEQAYAGFVSKISPGTYASEASQTVSFLVTNASPGLFAVQPAISPSGRLTFTPGSSPGTATIRVRAQDNGGTANGGVDTSAEQTFDIAIGPGAAVDLTNLVASSGSFTPAFDSATTAYAMTVPSTVTSTTLTATLRDASHKLTINGASTANATASPAIALSYGSNAIPVTVSTSTGSRSMTYTLTITRSPVVPVVTTPTLGTFTAYTAIFGGNITSDGGSAITERGVVYALTATNADPLIGGTGVSRVIASGTDVGAFNTLIGGLASGSNYSLKAYATNAAGTGYTTVSALRTPVTAPPEITSVSPTASLVAGGGTITIKGRYFTGTASVTIGGVAATGVAVADDDTITATIPAGTLGAKNVIVTTNIGTGKALTNGFRYSDLIVTSTSDSGAGSLRQMLLDAQDISGANIVTFATALSGQTISLSPSSESSAFIINDTDGVTVDASSLTNGITLTRASSSVPCRGFIVRSGSALTLRSLTVDGMSGAVQNLGTFTAQRCTFTSNQGTEGGAINSQGSTTLEQCTLANNVAARGGALWHNGSALMLRHCTIAGNRATAEGGGGLFLATSGTIENSIVAGNSGVTGPDIFNSASIVRVGTSIVQAMNAGSVSGAGSILAVDPQLTGLIAQGGPTRTMGLQSSSPAINASTGSSITSDQRGVAVVGIADIGAVEFQASLPILGTSSVSAITATTTTLNGTLASDGGATITERGFTLALVSANTNPQIGGSGVTKIVASNSGVFTANATSLTSGINYNFRAFATNSFGTSYAPAVSFRTLSNNADLASLAGVALSPGFAASTTSYTASVANSTTSAALSFTTASTGAKTSITANGIALTSSTISLKPGANTVSVRVTAEDGTTKTYDLIITRAANLPVLTMIRNGSTIDAIIKDKGGVAVTETGVVLALVATNSNPTIGGTGVTKLLSSWTYPSGNGFNVSLTGLSPGATYAYAVYATNSAGTGYSAVETITTPSSQCDLSALTVSTGTLAPAFATSTLNYTAVTAQTTVTLVATAAQQGSIIKINGNVTGSGAQSIPVPLAANSNAITIVVSSPDETTSKTYTVTYTRSAGAPIVAAAATKSQVRSTSAILGGTITGDNGDAITERGIVYALTSVNASPAVTNGTKAPEGSTSLGAFTVNVSGLNPSQAYSFRAYAINTAGPSYSNVSTFTTGPNQTNLAPSFDLPASSTVTVAPGAGAVSLTRFATNITAGLNEDANQVVSFQLSTNNNALFKVLPAISKDGTLTFTPGITTGQATVTVTLSDDGGTASGGVDTSVAKTFDISVDSSDSIGTWSTAAWTDDTSTGWSAGRTIFACCFGNGGSTSAVSVNGVSVSRVISAGYESDAFALSGLTQTNATAANPSLGTGGSASIARGFISGGDPLRLKLKQLIPGSPYVLTFLSIGAEAAGTRLLHIASGSDVRQMDQGEFGAGNGIRVSYTFTASSEQRVITLAPATFGGGTFQLYGMALSVGASAVNSSPTNLSLSSNHFLENQPADLLVGLLSTTDADANQRHTYELVSGAGSDDNNLFVLKGNALFTTFSADRETKSYYQIRVRTRDNGFPSESFERALTLSVDDVNEPGTSLSLPQSIIDENTTDVGLLTVIGDPDSTSFNFSLVSGAGSTDNALVSITNTNHVVLKQPADYEAKSSYAIRVHCVSTDRSTGVDAFEFPLTIQVRDVIELPVVTAIPDQTILEDSGALTVKMTVTFFDQHYLAYLSNDFAGASSSLTSTNEPLIASSSIRTILTNEAFKTIGGVEAYVADYTVTLGRPAANASGETIIGLVLRAPTGEKFLNTSFKVTVRPVNDAPSFRVIAQTSQPAFNRSFSVPKFITDVSAGPLEGTQKVSFGQPKFISGNQAIFTPAPSVDASGTLTFGSSSPTVEGSATFSIQATDDGGTDFGGVNASEQQFVLKFQANSSPTDIILTGSLDVPENTTSNVDLGTLSTVDPDGAQTHTYSIAAAYPAVSNFAIAGNKLTFKPGKSVLDFESAASVFSVDVKSTDNGTPPASFTKFFKINITNVNEAPTNIVMVSDVQKDAASSRITGTALTCPENKGAGTLLGRLFLIDPDFNFGLEETQAKTWALVSGTGSDDNARFTITSGNELTIVDNLDYETTKQLKFRLRGTDTGTPALNIEKAFVLTVIDTNDAPYNVALSNSSIAEGRYEYPKTDADALANPARYGYIGTLTATDPEGTALTWSLPHIEDRTYFRIIGNKLFWTGSNRHDWQGGILDYEGPNKVFNLRVNVRDSGANGWVSSTNDYLFTGQPNAPITRNAVIKINVTDADEPTLLRNLKVMQRPGTNKVDISYDVFDADTPSSVIVTMEGSTDGGVTWAVPMTSFEGVYGLIKCNARDPRTEPTEDGLTDNGSRVEFQPADRRLSTWNAGRNWKNQFSSNFRVRVTLTVGSTTVASLISDPFTVDTKGDGNLNIKGRLIDISLAGQYNPWPTTPDTAVITIGTQSVTAKADGTFELPHAAAGDLTVSHSRLKAPYIERVDVPAYGTSVVVRDIWLSNAPAPTITNVELPGMLTGQNPGTALEGFLKVPLKATIDWKGARGRKVTVTIGGRIYQEDIAFFTNSKWSSYPIDYSTYFKAGDNGKPGYTDVTVRAENEFGTQSDLFSTKIKVIGLPPAIKNLMDGTPLESGWVAPNQIGFTTKMKWPEVESSTLTKIGKLGAQPGSLGYFDYDTSTGQWEFLEFAGELDFFGNQYSDSLYLKRDKAEEDVGTQFRSGVLDVGNNLLDTGKKSFIAYLGKGLELETAYAQRMKGRISASNFSAPSFEMPDRVLGSGGLAATLPLPGGIAFPTADLPVPVRTLPIELELTLKIALSSSREQKFNSSSKQFDTINYTSGMSLEPRATLMVGTELLGVAIFAGGEFYTRLGTKGVEETKLELYAGASVFLLFYEQEFKVVVLRARYQKGDASNDTLASASSVAPSPQVRVIESSAIHPMKRPWLARGPESFLLAPVAAPATIAQVRAVKTRNAAAAAPPTVAVIDPDLQAFNRLGAPEAGSGAHVQSIASDASLPVQATLPLLNNVFPKAAPAMTEKDGKIMLLYVRDRGVTSAMHFAEIAYTYYNGTSWTTPGAVSTNARGQSMPQVHFDGQGNAVAVWVQLKDLDYAGEGGLAGQAAQMELVSSTWDPNTGAWSTPVPLTDNNVIDSRPVLAGPLSDGDLLLTWVRNNDNEFLGTAAMPDAIQSTRWDAASRTWSPSSRIISGIAGLTSHGFDARGDQAVFAWTQDSETSTTDHSRAEVWRATWNGSAWSAPTRTTTDEVADQSLRVAINSSGDVFTVWQHGADLVMDRNFSGTPSTVRAGSAASAFADFGLATGANGNLLVTWKEDVNQQFDAFYRVYDVVTSTWSLDKRLSNDDDVEANLVPLWDSAGNLLIAYHNKQVIKSPQTITREDGSTFIVPDMRSEGRSDLLLARRRLITDLNIKPGSLKADAASWLPGSPAKIIATLVNDGDVPVNNATLSLYDGDPATGTLIQTVSTDGLLKGREEFQAIIDWTLPSDSAQHTIYVVADAANNVTELDETNNVLSRTIGGFDLALEKTFHQTLSDGSCRIAFRISNNGSPASPVTTLRLWDDPAPGAAPVAEQTVPALDPGAFAEVAFDLPAGSITTTERGFRAVVNEAFMKNEPNLANNSTRLGIAMPQPLSNLAGLADLAITGASIAPVFDTNTLAYTADVPFDLLSTNVVASGITPGCTITVNGNAVASNQASDVIALDPGVTRLTIVATSEDSSAAKTYTIDVQRSITSTDDSGTGSLRALVASAAARSGPDIIRIPASLDGQTITLTSPIVVNDPNGLVIDATRLEHGLTISGSGNHRLFEVAAGSSLTIIGVTLANGGGITFATTANDGGAIMNGGSLRLERCTVLDCKASNGGAIYNMSTGTLQVVQSTFADNGALDGAAIYNAGTATLFFSTIARNAADTLGGESSVTNAGTMEVENSIISDSTYGLDLRHKMNAVKLVYRGTNIIMDTSIEGTGVSGTVPLSISPWLDELGNYGGPTKTMPPGPSSPAIDQAFIVNALPATDQRGYPRTLGTNPDIGATEGRVLIVTTALDELDAPGTLGAGYSLREALRDAMAGTTILFDRGVFNGSTASANTITLTQGPINPPSGVALNGGFNPGGIQVNTQLSFVTQPASQSVLNGASATFTAAAVDQSGSAIYQWQKNGADIAGANQPGYSIASATVSDQAIYNVVITAPAITGKLTLSYVTIADASLSSQPASLVVGTASFSIAGQPSGAMLPLGGNHTLYVRAVGATNPTYQWMLNGKAIAKATASSYPITNAALTNAGAYSCVVKSGATSLTSSTAEVAVIDNKPKTIVLTIGGTFTPVLSASGNNLTYLWRRDTTTLASTAKTFVIKPVTLTDAGLYTCTVTGPGGSMSNGFNTTLIVTGSAPALGSISLPPAFIGQSYYYQLPVLPIAGAAATSFSVTGKLPAGITLNTATGVLSGRPTVTQASNYALSFKAINAKGSSAAVSDALHVIAIDANAIGTFAGPAPRSSLNDYLGGRFDLTTTITGTFSGSVTLGARAKIPFTNLLLNVSRANDQVLSGTLSGIAMADKTPLAAVVEVFPATQTARLTLTHPNGTRLVIPAWKPVSDVTSYATTYSARFNAGQGGETSPDGYGFSTFTVSSSSALTLAGRLPDGTAISSAGNVGVEGQVGVFQLLYASKGSLVGQLNITAATPVTNNTLSGALTWSKPATTDTNYKNGFGPLNVVAEGAAYSAPTAGNRVMNLPAASGSNANARLVFSLGGLSGSFPQNLIIANPKLTGLTNTATPVAPFNNATTLPMLTASTGAFNGSFTIPGATTALNRPAAFFGQIVTIGSTTQGWGYFLLPKVPVGTEKVTTSPKLSGQVELKTP